MYANCPDCTRSVELEKAVRYCRYCGTEFNAELIHEAAICDLRKERSRTQEHYRMGIFLMVFSILSFGALCISVYSVTPTVRTLITCTVVMSTIVAVCKKSILPDLRSDKRRVKEIDLQLS